MAVYMWVFVCLCSSVFSSLCHRLVGDWGTSLPYTLVNYVLSGLALISLRKRERIALLIQLLLVLFVCLCLSVCLYSSVVSSLFIFCAGVVYDWDISWSYTLVFLFVFFVLSSWLVCYSCYCGI